MNFDIDEHTVYLVTYGSHAYGTSTPESDEDVRGFAVAPKSHVQGFAYTFEQCERNDRSGLDSVIFDIRKFCKLAANCNPNIIETLFVDGLDVRMMHPAGSLIRANRDLFLSRKVRATFSGYAMDQLHKIKVHKGYLLNPPTHKPTREEFELTANMKITPDMMGAFDKMVVSPEWEGVEVAPNVMELVQREKQFKTAADRWKQYENWKAKRNLKRSQMERDFGYDGKHALHLVRLMTMCREILTGKGVIVKRPDAKELLAIRHGSWKYEDLLTWVDREDAEMFALCEKSVLPAEPDMNRLNDLCCEAQEIFWASQAHK